MPTLADLLGAPSEMEFEGKVYRLRPPNQLEQAQFSRWLERRAREAAARAVDLPPEIQDRMLQAVVRDTACGVYEWGSDASVAALQNPAGVAKLLQLVLSAEHPECDDEFARRLVEQKLKEVAAVLLGAAGTDPPTMAAVLAGLGLPPNFLGGRGTPTSGSETPPSDSPGPNSGG